MTNKEASEEISKIISSENISRKKLSTILGLKDQTLRNKISSNSFTSKNLENLNDYLNEDKKVLPRLEKIEKKLDLIISKLS